MTTMRCSVCGRLGIYWENLSGLSPYTYCPHCKARRLPVPEEQEEQDEDDDAASAVEMTLEGVDRAYDDIVRSALRSQGIEVPERGEKGE